MSFEKLLECLEERELTVLNNGRASLELSDSCWLDLPITAESLENAVLSIRRDFLEQVDDLLHVVKKYKKDK